MLVRLFLLWAAWPIQPGMVVRFLFVYNQRPCIETVNISKLSEARKSGGFVR
jgi:hypothetical protein